MRPSQCAQCTRSANRSMYRSATHSGGARYQRILPLSTNSPMERLFRVRRFARALAHTLTKKADRSCRLKDSGCSEGPCQNLCSADYCTHCLAPMRMACWHRVYPRQNIGMDAVIHVDFIHAVTAGRTWKGKRLPKNCGCHCSQTSSV